MKGLHVLLLGIYCLCPAVAAADLAAQRQAFSDALHAAKRGDAGTVAKYRDTLSEYPLAPYLDYYLIGNSFTRSDNTVIDAFIAANPGLPVNARLRRDWLHHLARHGRWSEFVDAWSPQNEVALRCHRVTAHIRTGQHDDPGITDEAIALWLTGRSQPDACDPVFAWMDESDRMTPALVRERVQLALDGGQYGLAGWLARRLDESDRDYVDRWRRMQQAPAQALASHQIRADTAAERALLVAGMERLARQQPERARAHWQRLSGSYAFDGEDRRRVLRLAALIAAQRHQPEAFHWLDEIAGADPAVDEWRVRTALRDKQWQAVLDVIDTMQDDADQDIWTYWRARALEQLDRGHEAHLLYERLAAANGYHAWLAAGRLGRPYRPRHALTHVHETAISGIEAHPAIIRAREFLAHRMYPEARAEWNAGVRGMGTDELVQAALLAHRWEWHSQAIVTLGLARDFTNLVIRYPLVYEQQILPQARIHGLDPALLFGLVRSESLFTPDARSGAGALGLMQLMPGTGREVARQLGLNPPDNYALLDPDTNVRLGSAYLGSVLKHFDYHETLATAAYNAGPHRVQRWIPRDESLPADIWVETIPFNETRNYVRQVMGGSAIFDWRMGRDTRPPSVVMRDIPASGD